MDIWQKNIHVKGGSKGSSFLDIEEDILNV
jgi:hypothetical protein